MRKLQLIKFGKIILITLLVNMISLSLFAQEIALHGKVVDETGEALIGATVKIAGTTIGTTTNISGDFNLKVPAGTTKITVSFLGYVDFEKIITKGATDMGKMALTRNTKDLNEVVVVGYGTIKRSDLTGTVASVDAKALKEVPASNVFEQLKGRVAGLDIVNGTNGPVLTLRGNRTIGSSTADASLIILDGQPYFNSIENIDPNDIKSVEVLKGASATAIYGSRASSGVLLITTNRGRVGQTVTSYDSYVGVSKLQGRIKLLDGQGFAQLQTDALQGAVLQGNGSVNPYALTTTEQQALKEGVSTDYVNLLIKPAYVWDQSLRVSGGTDKTQFNVGTSYRTTTGVEPNNSSRRVSLNATLDHKINKVIKFGYSTVTTLRILDASGGSQFQNAEYFSPLTYPYNADGSLNLTPQVGQIDAQNANPLLQGQSPDVYVNKTREFTSNNILYGELTPVKHLKYRYSVNYNFFQSLQDQYNGIDKVNNLSSINK
ncbi:TonB-dependent SusC/RagA subfamily outer membrane receptor [Mucilaginibacter gracilis]|uniref:TonB-dependent SusC/RagA subfamily outer membrane receptor n=1 Tax=Mucilaginibacter gracilis TaxID=423350 RepID=A0A495J0Z7_9SPHI|nr:carboxypeptidase-like regulatory domain-containing protein [Mucilaginibacter gracilis]RKR81779.1 TonB-dependent SusC/RagA subfamily outer membrane receptor [Mucilaginibacter gracilis]